MVQQSQVFGAGGANNSMPEIPVMDSYAKFNNTTASGPTICSAKYNVPGFVGDGDYVRLPQSAITNLEYYNAAQTLQWSVTLAQIVTGATPTWCHFQKNNGLIYIAGASAGGADLFFASVDAAGTVTSLGPAANFVITQAPDWHQQVQITKSSFGLFDLVNDIVSVYAISAANRISQGRWTISTGATIQDFTQEPATWPNASIAPTQSDEILFGTATTGAFEVGYGREGVPFRYVQNFNVATNSTPYITFPKMFATTSSSTKTLFWEDGYWDVQCSGAETFEQSRYWGKEDFESFAREFLNEATGAEL